MRSMSEVLTEVTLNPNGAQRRVMESLALLGACLVSAIETRLLGVDHCTHMHIHSSTTLDYKRHMSAPWVAAIRCLTQIDTM